MQGPKRSCTSPVGQAQSGGEGGQDPGSSNRSHRKVWKHEALVPKALRTLVMSSNIYITSPCTVVNIYVVDSFGRMHLFELLSGRCSKGSW